MLHLKPSPLLGDSLSCLLLSTEYEGAAGELLGQTVCLVGTRSEVRKSHSHLSQPSRKVLILKSKRLECRPSAINQPSCATSQNKRDFNI